MATRREAVLYEMWERKLATYTPVERNAVRRIWAIPMPFIAAIQWFEAFDKRTPGTLPIGGYSVIL
jgi:hypothetical protein